MRAVFNCLDAVLYQGGLQKSDRLDEDGFFVIVAVEQQIMDFSANWGAGVFQVVRQEIVCGDVQSVGNHDQEFETRISPSGFYVADMLIIYGNSLPEILLRHLFVGSISLDALAYAFVVEGHKYTFLSVRPAIGSGIVPLGFVHSNFFFKDGGRCTPIYYAILGDFSAYQD